MDSKAYQCSLANLNDPTAPPKAFTFDGCYHTDSTTEAIYNEIAYPLVEVRMIRVILVSCLICNKLDLGRVKEC